MSYHIYIKNKKKLSFKDILNFDNSLQDVKIAFGKDSSEAIEGYSKLYIPLESSRGVVITCDEEVYDIELNTGSSKEDYLLSTKIAVILAQLNNSKITPEFDNEQSITGFIKKYDVQWAEENQSLGIHALEYLILKEKSTTQLNGCIRPYYIGTEMLEELKSDNPNEHLLAERIVEKIRAIQYLELLDSELNVPTLMEADFPEGTRSLISIIGGFKLLILKADLIILRQDKHIVKVAFDEFIDYCKNLNALKRVDESQYILSLINENDYFKMITFFDTSETPKKKTWKFW